MKGEVQIYRNLHRNREDGGAVYSVRNSDGIVEGHESYLTLENCKLRVSDKGNERVRDEKKKNVHAYIQGKRALQWHQYRIITDIDLSLRGHRKVYDPVEITYNPYKHKTFVRVDTGEAVHEAKIIHTTPQKVFAVL